MMKRFASAAVLAAALLNSAYITGRTASKLTLTVEQLIDHTQPDKIQLALAIRNVSSQSVTVAKSDPISDYSIQIKDGQGRSVALSPYGEQLYRRSSVPSNERAVIVTLAPGEATADTVILSGTFDIVKPGNYKVVVTDKLLGLEPHLTATTYVRVPFK